MPQAHTVRARHAQQLTAPRLPIAAQPKTIEGQPQHGAREPPLGAHGGNMGVVVLHGQGAHGSCGGELRGVLGGEEIGVGIVRHTLQWGIRLPRHPLQALMHPLGVPRARRQGV